MESTLQLKKSAIGATTVTLVPSTAAPGENEGEAGITEIVVTTGAITPPVGFWGAAAADGYEYVLTLRRRT